jgi:hypothetical protein
MKTIGRSVFAIFLAMMAPLALVANAQNSLTNPAALTQEQVNQLNSTLQQQRSKIVKLQGSVSALTTDQKRQGAALTKLNGRTEKLETDSAATAGNMNNLKGDVQDLKKSDGATQATMSTMEKWVSVIGILAILAAVASVLFLIYMKRKAAEAISEKEVKAIVQKEVSEKTRDIVREERPLSNPSTPELRKEWLRLRKEKPVGDIFIECEKRFVANPDKGHDTEGAVRYFVYFDDTRSTNNQIPKWLYDGKRVPHDELAEHALRILRAQQAEEQRMGGSPIKLLRDDIASNSGTNRISRISI